MDSRLETIEIKNGADRCSMQRLVRPFVLARPWEQGLPIDSWKQRKQLRIHEHGIRVGEREIPKEKTDRTFPDDGKIRAGDYVQDGRALYIAKYNWGGFFTLHRFIFRFGANHQVQIPEE